MTDNTQIALTRRIDDAKIQTALNLDSLAEEMTVIACSMQFVAGFDSAWAARADDIIVMAAKVKQWANNIEAGNAP